MALSEPQATSSSDKVWHHRGPVKFSPVFDWPSKPLDIFLALTKRWVTVTRNLLFLLIAICTYNYFLPEMAEMKSLSPDWILPVLFRNIALLMVIAGGLHLYLFTFRKQGKRLKFDAREEFEKSKRFTFGNQLHDNIFWSLTSGALVWTAYEILYYWGIANQVIPVLGFSDAPFLFLLWLLVLPTLLSTHFYFVHRWLHWPRVYKRVHQLHHRNIHIGPWTGMSMHPVEHIFYISSVLIHFVIPSHPVIMLVHLYIRCLAPAFSHSGFEKLMVGNKVVTESADFHHQLHHKFFDCNYGNIEVPLDRWLGIFHDGTEEGTKHFQEQRLAMYHKRKPTKKKPRKKPWRP